MAGSKQAATSELRQGVDRPLLALSGLCNSAAEHVARARIALFTESADADAALHHLDDAIGCLKNLLAESKIILADEPLVQRKSA
jgi:hypothetical protein